MNFSRGGDRKSFKTGEKHIQKMEFASISMNLPPRKQQRSDTKACRDIPSNPMFEVGAAPTTTKLNIVSLASHRPIALFGLLPRPLVLFSAGALSGAIAKTITAPLDRVKILLQVSGGLDSGLIGQAARKGSLIQSLIAVGKQEGLPGYWKGNLPQVLRVVPYSAAQLYSYEVFKQAFADENGDLSVKKRLMAGAAAGMTATLVRNYRYSIEMFKILIYRYCYHSSGLFYLPL
jgi:Mitochondrial carrier protein